jgi:hypothetical protein
VAGSDRDQPTEYMAAAFNGADLETGSIFSKDESLTPEDEKFQRKFRRRVKVRHGISRFDQRVPGL